MISWNTVLFGVFFLIGCSSEETIDIQVSTDQAFYHPGDLVKIDLTISNQGGDSFDLKKVKLLIRNLDNRQVYEERNFELSSHLGDANSATAILNEVIWQIPDSVKGAPFGVFASYPVRRKIFEAYQTFFSIGNDISKTTYDLSFTDYKGLPVYKLERGLSAEYTVQKAAAALAGGISHSWGNSSPGAGPLPVVSTRDFLDRSIQKTVDFYNEQFGENQEFETVIISTGIPSGAYLARAMNAPVLPIHFLVGAHTIREVETMLEYSQADGISAYATVGHDYSLSETQSVAWIKLLNLPEAYSRFLKDHKVKNVIFHGALGKGGESGSRKVKNGAKHYGAGSIYVMHFAGDESETYLKQTIRDLDFDQLGPFVYIADWEAGIIEQQVDSIGAAIKSENQKVEDITVVTTHDAIHLWNMGSYLMLSLLQKNDLEFNGISFNPYLIGHPVFETYKGYIPFLYWQGFDPQHHIDNRLKTVIAGSVENFYPGTKFGELDFWVNSTNNFGGAGQGAKMSATLKDNGYLQVIDNEYEVDEVWNEQDGLNAVCEVRADILTTEGAENLQKWNENLNFLSVSDLHYIAEQFPDILVISK